MADQKNNVRNAGSIKCQCALRIDLRERTIRVEEELKHQRELMTEGFKQMEKRFEQESMGSD